MESTQLSAALQQSRILIVGDVMLDRYWFGAVERISPEAPVPVVKVESIEDRPGGAANVAANVVALGANATLLAVIGADETGQRLQHLLQNNRLTATLHIDSSIQTTMKLRVIARQQQLIRLDFEHPPSHDVLAAKLEDFQGALQQHQVIILSDYAKGSLTHVQAMIKAARAMGKKVLVDPKGIDYSRYHGASVLTPNYKELWQVVGGWLNETALTEKAQALRRELQLDALLLTRSDEGMSLYHSNGVTHQATVAQEVYDVSGAGDTVIAALGCLLAAGAPLELAMCWSNRAASIVVAKLGTAVATLEELLKANDGLTRQHN